MSINQIIFNAYKIGALSYKGFSLGARMYWVVNKGMTGFSEGAYWDENNWLISIFLSKQHLY